MERGCIYGIEFILDDRDQALRQNYANTGVMRDAFKAGDFDLYFHYLSRYSHTMQIFQLLSLLESAFKLRNAEEVQLPLVFRANLKKRYGKSKSDVNLLNDWAHELFDRLLKIFDDTIPEYRKLILENFVLLTQLDLFDLYFEESLRK